MTDQLPEHYYCPVCNREATKDFIATMKEKSNMPMTYIVSMAMNILYDAKCPEKLLKPIGEWFKTYGQFIDVLNQEEQDKLALKKWEQWAKGKSK